MYASKIVETSEAGPLFDEPLHPYTQGLLRSLPRLGAKKKRLEVIGGSVPDPLNFPDGCKFHPRCSIGSQDRRCQTKEPPLVKVSPGRCTACWHAKGYT
jgi:oligopeptide/dipeptide ABC transporter ATP-binding protein